MRNVRATGPLWAVKTGYIVVSVLFCVLGVVLLVMSERCVPWIGRALGIGMVVCGAIKLGGYFSKDLFRLAFQYDLAFGILLIAVGIITLCHPGEAMSFLCVIFGIPVLADGLFKIQIAMDSRQFGIRNWWLVLVLAVIGCTSLPRQLWGRWEAGMKPAVSDGLRTVWMVLVLLVSVAFLVGDSYNPFLYFRF